LRTILLAKQEFVRRALTSPKPEIRRQGKLIQFIRRKNYIVWRGDPVMSVL
jgi:hypothetical protein